MADVVEKFCCRWHANKPGGNRLIVMVGDTGTGKTTTMMRALQWCRNVSVNAWEAGGWGKASPQVALLTLWPEIVAELRAFNRSSLADLFELDLVCLDDIGADNDRFEAGTDALCQVLTRRANNWTMVTTNIPIERWADKWDVRVASRLQRNSVIVDLSGVPDYCSWLADQQ